MRLAIATAGAMAAMAAMAAIAAMAAMAAIAATVAVGAPPFAVVGDAIPAPLADAAGDPARGRAIVVDRRIGLCLLCHSGPFPEERFQGDLAPDLSGVGARLSAGQLRLRIADGRRLDPSSMMPSYFRTDGLVRVGAAWRDMPLMTAQQVEDVVAFLATLR